MEDFFLSKLSTTQVFLEVERDPAWAQRLFRLEVYKPEGLGLTSMV